MEDATQGELSNDTPVAEAGPSMPSPSLLEDASSATSSNEVISSVPNEIPDTPVEISDTPLDEDSSHTTLIEPARPKKRILPLDNGISDLTLSPKTGKKRPRTDNNHQAEDEDDEETVCNICLEPWTNSGEHRIASLKCGHFFGLSCIEKWLKGGKNGCPNCNEKSSKKDLRVHYVVKLKALDTSERDRAVLDLEKAKRENRQLELELTTLKVFYDEQHIYKLLLLILNSFTGHIKPTGQGIRQT